MSRQNNILSFDDAKRARSARSFSVSGDGSAAIAHQRRGHAVLRSSSAVGGSQGSRRSSARRVNEYSTSASSRRKTRTSFDSAGSSAKRGNSRDLRGSASQSFSSSRSNSFDFDGASSAASSPSKRTRSEERKHKRDKARAGKMYSKQFAASSNSDASENGPRAAVFKGEMGHQHRRAARMQASNAAAAAAFAPLSALAALPEVLGRVFRSKKSAVAAFIVACVVLSCVFLYTPAQQYYQSVRDAAQLQAEYEAVQQRNAALEEENDALQTDAGVETELRERYNYVKSGEQTANVSGLSENAMRNDSGDTVTGIVASGSVKAPDTWYSGVLDKVFGYNG